MIKALPEFFEPRVGLSSVADADNDATSRLPDDARLHPIDASVEARLRAILQADTIDALILDAVKPLAFDREILAPSRFHVLREEVLARLVSLQGHARTAEEMGELQAAATLLRTRSREHELGETMRYALLKG